MKIRVDNVLRIPVFMMNIFQNRLKSKITMGTEIEAFDARVFLKLHTPVAAIEEYETGRTAQ